MAIPEGVPRRTVTTGKPYISPGGAPAKGRLTFTGPDLVTVGALELLLGGGEAMYLSAGIGTLDLVPSDVEGMNPRGWPYAVTAEFGDGTPGWTRYLLVESGDGPLQLSEWLTPDPGTATYVPVPGPAGAAGSAGPKGDQGDTGAQGPAGPAGGGSLIASLDVAIDEEIIVLPSAAAWTIVTTSGGTEVGASIPAKVGDRIWFSPSFMRTGGTVFLDMGIRAAAGGVSRYISSKTGTPKGEGYAPLYPQQATFPGVVGIRQFVVQAGEVDGSGNAKIVLAYKGTTDGSQKIYAGSGYDFDWFIANPDAA